MQGLVLLLIAAVGQLASIVAEQGVLQVQLSSSGSRSERLQKVGKYAEFLRQFDTTRANGSQSLTDWFDITYTMRITVGTPPRNYDVALESSSSASLWIVDVSCTQNCNGPDGYTKKKYNRTVRNLLLFKSSSASSSGVLFASGFYWQQYGGYIQGSGITDIVKVANLNITGQPFVSVTSISNGYVASKPADGVIGLAWPPLVIDDSLVPVMQNLLPQLDAPIFTVFLERNEGAEGTPNGGMITFGGLDTTNCNRNVTYAPLTTETYWQFGIDGVSLGNFSVNRFTQAMAATDITFIGGPQSAVTSMMQAIGATYNQINQEYRLSCASVPSLPTLHFTVAGNDLTIPPDYYMRQTDIGDGNCTVAIYAYPGGGFGPQWVFGQTFMHVYCAVHDVGNSQIGFARALRV